MATIDRKGVHPNTISVGTKYLGLEHIERGGAVAGFETIGEVHVASTKFSFTDEHVLFGKLRPNLGKIARPDFPGVCSTDILPILPGEHLDRNYLAHYLSQKRMIDLAATRATGANLPRLSPGELVRFEIPLPPLTEQRRIAAVLDRADSLRKIRRGLLDGLETLRKSVFRSELAADGARSWPVAKVEDVAEQRKGSIRTGPFGSQLLHSEFVDEGIAVLGIDNAVHNEFRWGEERYITPEKYAKLKRYTVNPGDVLVTIMGTCGRVAIVPDDIPTAINTKHLCCITVDRDRCIPEFLHASLLWQRISRSHMQRSTKGAIMRGLNMGIVKATPLRLPPVAQQHRIVEKLEAISRERARQHKNLELLDDLFASLQSRAFTGRL